MHMLSLASCSALCTAHRSESYVRHAIAQGDAGPGSEALSSVVLDIEKGKLEREVQTQVSAVLHLCRLVSKCVVLAG